MINWEFVIGVAVYIVIGIIFLRISKIRGWFMDESESEYSKYFVAVLWPIAAILFGLISPILFMLWLGGGFPDNERHEKWMAMNKKSKESITADDNTHCKYCGNKLDECGCGALELQGKNMRKSR